MTLTRKGNKVTMEFELIPEGQERTSTGKNFKAYSSQGFKYEEGLGYSINIIYAKK
jgi:hypothetical protein